MREKYLIAHVFFFSFGYSMLSFELPPFLTLLGANQFYLGEMGFLLMLPNILLPILFFRISDLKIVYRLIVISVLITDFSILFFYFIKSLEILLFLILLIGVGQFIWWITTEIFFSNLSRDSKLINIYSSIWGIAYFIAPLVSSYFISIFGYGSNLIFSFLIIFFSLVLLISYRPKQYKIIEQTFNNGKKIFVDSFFPSFGVGLVFSIFYSIFPGFLFKNGYSILLLGIIITASSLTRLIGFFLVINLRDVKNMERIMKFSFLLLLFIIFPFFTLNFFVILIMALVIGFGSSVGISIPLIYISKKKDSDISKNIAIYELSFGASVSIFSLFLGWISQNYGNKTPYLI
ncbi:MAG: MFS transporter, partial [Thermoplasmata archaeon]